LRDYVSICEDDKRLKEKSLSNGKVYLKKATNTTVNFERLSIL
jgi:hypothetical protein